MVAENYQACCRMNVVCSASDRAVLGSWLCRLILSALSTHPVEAGVCSNGIDGVESETGDYCCPSSCGICDGADCAADGEGCCGAVIEESGVMCDVSEVAPCIIDGTSFVSRT